MFDIGFLELILIAIIALLVLGPERLPVAARNAGRWIGKARRMVNQFTREIDRQIEAEDLRKELEKQGESLNISEDVRNIQRTVQEALDEAKVDRYAHEDQPHGDFEPLPREDEPERTIHPSSAAPSQSIDQAASTPTDSPASK